MPASRNFVFANPELMDRAVRGRKERFEANAYLHAVPFLRALRFLHAIRMEKATGYTWQWYEPANSGRADIPARWQGRSYSIPARVRSSSSRRTTMLSRLRLIYPRRS